MAVPSTIADLDTTAGNNDPSGSNAPSVLDDHLRALAAIVKQNVSKGADIASSSTITVPNSGGYFVVTGTTTINGINDCWNGRAVLLKFSGALTLTNSASLILFGSNIAAAAGDTLFIVNESAGVWRAVAFTSGTSGMVTTAGTQTLTNKTIEAVSNTITTAASGNLAATELNAALAELQGDIDTRSTTSHTHSGVYEPVQTSASQAEMEAGTEAALRSMSPLRVKQAVDEFFGLPIRNGSTETLTASEMNMITVLASTATITLPLLSTVKNGQMVAFQMNAAATVIVNRQASDEISWSGHATLNSVPLRSYGDYLLLVADTVNSRWRVLSENISGPSFLAQYEGAGQSIGTATETKLQFNTEISDSHGCFDPSINYRFTPTIPGWYQVSVSAYLSAGASRCGVILYKNGSLYTYGQRSYSPNDGVYTGSFPVYLNGTTDYIEAYGVSLDLAGTFDDTLESNFSAVRIR